MNDLDLAFGGRMKDLLPEYSTLPGNFRSGNDPFTPLVNKWFFSGLEKKALKVKEGIDESDAWRHMKAIMGSFEPSHEHKTAGVAYLMSQWFEKS